MSDTTTLYELMAADVETHQEQARLMRRGNRIMAIATLALAIALASSLAGGWWVIQSMQEQNAANLELLRQKVIMRI